MEQTHLLKIRLSMLKQLIDAQPRNSHLATQAAQWVLELKRELVALHGRRI